MPLAPAKLESNWRATLDRLRDACARAGRDPADARLIAVSKTHPPEVVRALADAGQTRFGENRVQEALEKIDAVGAGPRWHLIGHLQKNKAKHVVGRFELIHGVDNEALARELDKRADRAGVVQPVLAQVRLGGEESKFGVEPGGLPALVDRLLGCAGLALQGLMTIPPPVERAEDSRRWFVRLRELRDAEAERTGRPLPELSMGMTDDFEVAAEEGATLVRVGRAIFGPRG